jgi:hypothetical protein
MENAVVEMDANFNIYKKVFYLFLEPFLGALTLKF